MRTYIFTDPHFHWSIHWPSFPRFNKEFDLEDTVDSIRTTIETAKRAFLGDRLKYLTVVNNAPSVASTKVSPGDAGAKQVACWQLCGPLPQLGLFYWPGMLCGLPMCPWLLLGGLFEDGEGSLSGIQRFVTCVVRMDLSWKSARRSA